MVARPDSTVFAALADVHRLSFIERLQRHPQLATTELAEGTGLSRQAVRKHLDVLQRAGLVANSRSGRQRLWRLDATPLEAVADWALDIRTHWETRFDQLDAFLTRPDGASDEP